MMRELSFSRPYAGPSIAALLAVGLVVAIVTDGSLPIIWRQVLFAILALLDAVMVYWLFWARSG